jgi:transposase
VERFHREEEVAAYAGLTPRVHQSGSQDYHGSISKSGSPWLRWILVEASIKVIRKDPALQAFHQRVRRRSGWRRARVAVARKLAVICWKRLRAWERQRPAA